MHMADALISPAVGGTMWAATAGLSVWCARKVHHGADDGRVPLMGVLGAFVFAAQMVNFAIPGTGSSGHLGGGLLLAILLGPHAAFLAMASILAVQALLFADGGLLAFGCNVVNMGFFPCFIAYPLYRRLAGRRPSRSREAGAAVFAAVVALELGALAVVLLTVASGISDLPLGAFALFMLPIHLAIGIAEGFVTAGVVAFVRGARPELLAPREAEAPERRSVRGLLISFLLAAALIGGVVAWFASGDPDGLEWSVDRATGGSELEAPPGALAARMAEVQEKAALLPDYGFPGAAEAAPEEPGGVVDAGTTVSGLVGGALTLLLTAMVGMALRPRRRSSPEDGG